MLLGVGMVTGILGYTTLVWGVGMANNNPASFGYLLGISKTNTAPNATSQGAGTGTGSGILGDAISFLWKTSPASLIIK